MFLFYVPSRPVVLKLFKARDQHRRYVVFGGLLIESAGSQPGGCVHKVWGFMGFATKVTKPN